MTSSQLIETACIHKPKKVVIVDDSKSMRMWLRHILDNDTRLHVAGEAANAAQARKVILEVDPDVITLDIDMPGMSGLEFLDRIMRLRPKPVVMISAATLQGSDAAIKALALGAVDCIAKPQSVDLRRTKRDLVRRVFSAACSQPRLTQKITRYRSENAPVGGRMPIVLIGASTGGVAALDVVLQGLNPKGPPVVVVQHMPSEFLVSFCHMLNRNLEQHVGMVRDGAQLRAGQVMLAPVLDQLHTHISARHGQWFGHISGSDTPTLHHPSIDVLFESAQACARDVIAVVLTGLGRDGATGAKVLHDAGAKTLTQDEASSVVYGMPRAALELGGVQEQCPLDEIGPKVNALVSQLQVEPRSEER